MRRVRAPARRSAARSTAAAALTTHRRRVSRRCTLRYSSLRAPDHTVTLMMMPPALSPVTEPITPSHSVLPLPAKNLPRILQEKREQHQIVGQGQGQGQGQNQNRL